MPSLMTITIYTRLIWFDCAGDLNCRQDLTRCWFGMIKTERVDNAYKLCLSKIKN